MLSKLSRVFTLLLLSFSSILFCQNNEVDSLLAQLKKPLSDSVKIAFLSRLGEICEVNEILKYTQPVIKLTKNKYYTNTTYNKNFYITQLANAYNNSGVFYDNTGRADSAEYFYKLALKVYQSNTDKNGEASALNNLGYLYEAKGKNADALEYHYKSLQLRRELNDSENIAVSLNNIGLIYTKQGQKIKALDFLLKCYPIAQQVKNSRLESVVLGNIASVYSDSKEYTMALNYQLKSLKLNEELNDKSLTANTLYNIGVIYIDQKNFHKALEYFKRSYGLQAEINDKKGASISLIEMGQAYISLGNTDSAISTLNSGLKLAIESDSKYNECDAHRILGEIYYKKKDFTKALQFGEKSLELSKELGYPLSISKSAQHLKKTYEALNNYKKALVMASLYAEMKDSMYNQNARNSAIRSQLQLEFIEKETDLKNEQQQHLEKLKMDNEIIKNRNQRNFAWAIFAIGTLLLLSLLFGILQTAKRKRIELKNESDKMLFKLQAINAQMNPHFIFNAINSIQHYILSNESQYAYDYLAKFGKLIRLVLIHSESNFISLRDEVNLLTIYIELEQKRFKNRFNYKIIFPPELDEIKIPTMLIQPLLENAIWHGIMNLDETIKGEIVLSFGLTEKILKITIEDNGVGMTESAKRRSKQHESVGINFTQKRLDLFKAIQMQDAKISITDLVDTTNKCCGTKVVIELPIHV